MKFLPYVCILLGAACIAVGARNEWFGQATWFIGAAIVIAIQRRQP